MNRLLPLAIALFITAACFGQTVETVSERFHYKYVKPETKPTIEQIQKENETRQRNWQEEFDAMKASLDDSERVSDNVKLTVNTEVKFPDLIVSVAYETIKLTLKGKTKVGGSVFGGGEESVVDGNTEVIVNDQSRVYGNIYGGGNMGEVGGNTKVILNGVEL